MTTVTLSCAVSRPPTGAPGRSSMISRSVPGCCVRRAHCWWKFTGSMDDRALVDPESHRALIDVFGGLTAEAESVAQAFATYRAADKAVTDHEKRIEAARNEADFLRAAVDELSALKPGDRRRGTAGCPAHRHDGSREDRGRSQRSLRNLEWHGVADPGACQPAAASGAQGPTRCPTCLGRLCARWPKHWTFWKKTRGGLETALRETEYDPRELEAR